MMGATRGAGTAYPSGAPEVSSGVRITRSSHNIVESGVKNHSPNTNFDTIFHI
jgi:hypothetical protein